MSKKFNLEKDSKEFKSFIDDVFLGATKESIVPVMSELLRDSNNLAPIDKSFLVNSGITESEINNSDGPVGLIVYGVDYAKERYFKGSKSGETRWVESAFFKNIKKTKDIIISVMENKK